MTGDDVVDHVDEYDWEEFLARYTGTSDTLRKICSSLKIPYKVAMVKARSEGWKRPLGSRSTSIGLSSAERRVCRINKRGKSTGRHQTLNGNSAKPPIDLPEETEVPEIGLAINVHWIKALQDIAKHRPGHSGWLPPTPTEEQVVLSLIMAGQTKQDVRDVVAPNMPMRAFEIRHKTIIAHGVKIAAAKMANSIYAAGISGSEMMMKFWMQHMGGWTEKHLVDHKAEITVIDFRRDFNPADTIEGEVHHD